MVAGMSNPTHWYHGNAGPDAEVHPMGVYYFCVMGQIGRRTQKHFCVLLRHTPGTPVFTGFS